MNSPRPTQSYGELHGHVADHLAFLVEGAERFDAGSARHAKQMATSLRVLLHDEGRNSHAALEQIGVLHKLRWIDSAGPLNDRNLATSMNLIGVLSGPAGASYIPTLNQFEQAVQMELRGRRGAVPRGRGRMLAFDDWWNMPVVRDTSKHDFSRKDLVLAVANTDGGAHVDPAVPADYHRLSRSNSLGLIVNDASGERTLGNPVDASIRQITHEVLRSVPRRLRPGVDYTANGTPG